MTNYNDGNWHPWFAGRNPTCPVHPKSRVQVMIRDGGSFTARAYQIEWGENWGTTIVAFRVTGQHQEPREFGIWTNDLGERFLNDVYCPNAIHVREVMPDGSIP